jgi:hypothetical protein
MITNPDSGTRIDEIVDGIYRISTPVTVIPGGFSFNQYLIVDDAPLLFHTGLRRMFPLVREAIGAVMSVERLLTASRRSITPVLPGARIGHAACGIPIGSFLG